MDQKKSPDLADVAKSGDAVFHPRLSSAADAHSAKRRENTIAFRSSGFRIMLLAAPSHLFRQWHSAAFVPGYGGGSATDFNRLP
jgi:hypothetical protein